MAGIELANVHVRYDDTVAVRGIDLEIKPGELHALLGASGSGKTTLLRAIAGFVRVSLGTVSIGDLVVDSDTVHYTPPEKRNVGVVFQDYALFPNLDVLGNVSFAKRDKQNARAVLADVGLSEFATRHIADLSGGEQQRVALARALAQQPDVMLLDEPFSNLNPQLRAELRNITVNALRSRDMTGIFVTHDRDEAFVVADRISVIHRGVLAQTGSAVELYNAPATADVALALGSASFIKATANGSNGACDCALGTIPVRGQARDGRLVLRPEQIELTDGGAPATVESVQYLGSVSHAVLRLSSGEPVIAQCAPGSVSPGQRLGVTVTGFSTIV